MVFSQKDKEIYSNKQLPMRSQNMNYLELLYNEYKETENKSKRR